MPISSREFKEYAVPSIGGGLQRSIRWSLMEPGRWRSSRGFRPDRGRAMKVNGYRQFVGEVLSPQYQDYIIHGACWVVDNHPYPTPASPVKGICFTHYHPTNQLEFFRNDLADAVNWEFKLEEDEDSAWTDITTCVFSAPPLGGVILMDSLYPGTTFGSLATSATTAPELRRFMIRRKAGNGGTCPVNRIERIEFTPGIESLFVATPRDWYIHDGGNEEIADNDRRTPTYTTGTVSGIAGAVVTGVTTAWDTSGAEAQMLFKMDADPAGAWTPILTVDGALQITLDDTYRGATSSGNYTILLNYAAGSTDLETARSFSWSTIKWLNGSPAKMMIATNGLNRVQKALVSGNLQDLGGLDAIGGSVDLEAARYVMEFDERVLLGYTTEDGVSYPRRWRWSDRLDSESWTSLKFRDLPGWDEIVGAAILGGVFVSFGSHSITNIRPVGAPYDFGITPTVAHMGCRAGGSIQNIRNQTIIFMGPDDIYSYDLVSPSPVGADVRDLIYDDLNDSIASQIVSTVDEKEALYLLSVPTNSGGSLWNYVTYAYDFENKVWLEPYEGFMSYGRHLRAGTVFIDDMTDPIDSYTDPFDGRVNAAQAPVLLAGGRTGNLLQLFNGSEADYAELPGSLVSGMTDLGNSGLKRLGWIVLKGIATGATIEVRIGSSLDGEQVAQWSPTTVLELDEDTLNIQGIHIPVNMSGRFFCLEVTADKRRQVVELDSVIFYFRKRTRR